MKTNIKMDNNDMIQELGLKAYNQFNERFNRFYKDYSDSELYKQEVEYLYELNRKINRLVYNIVSMDIIGHYTMILTLSAHGNTKIDQFKEKRGVKIEY